MKDGKIVIACDIDDTLIIPPIATGKTEHTPNYKIISILKWFKEQGYYIILWSGTGPEWAKRWGDELGVSYDEIRIKQKYDDVDICIDDCIVDLAKVNLKIKRVNNKVKRNRYESKM